MLVSRHLDEKNMRMVGILSYACEAIVAGHGVFKGHLNAQDAAPMIVAPLLAIYILATFKNTQDSKKD